MRCELSMLFRSKASPTFDHPSHERFLSIRQFRRPRPTPRRHQPSPLTRGIGQIATASFGAGGSGLGRHDDGAGGGELGHALRLRVLEAELGTSLTERGGMAAGHSLGEYAALAAVGRMSIIDAA